ncbi:DUF6529 family protein [Nocardioides dilutus]
MATASPSAQVERPRTALVVAVGAAVAVVLGVYGKVHDPALEPLVTLGFSGMLQMKSWLATLALLLVLVQLGSALWMWQRLPLGPPPAWVTPAHRWSGTVAFVVSLPVALHCLWSLGLATSSPRVLVHGVAGCCFYGAYAAKMVGLRVSGLPKWGLPVLGGLTFGLFVLLWLTSALWFFTRSGIPLT